MYSKEKQCREVFDKIYSSFRIYYIPLMLITNTPLFIGIQNHKIRTKLRRIVHYSRLISLCVVYYRIALTVFFHSHSNEHFSMLNKGLLLLILIPSLMLGFVGTVKDRYDLLLKYLKRLSEADLMLKLNGFHFDEGMYVISCRRNKLLLCYLVTISIITTTTAGYAIDFNYLGAMMIGVGLGAKALFQFMMASKLFEAKNRFGIINGAIDELIQKSKKKRYMTSGLNCKSVITGRIYICCRIHYRLCSVLRESLGELQLLLFLSISSTIFTMFYSIFNIYYLITDRNTSITLMHRSSWVVFQLLELFVLVSACSKTCESANKTPILLHELRNKTPDINIEDHVQMYSLQLLHQKLRITAGEIIDIDYAFMFSLIGNMVTYLILLIQFELPVEREQTKMNVSNTN